MSKTARDTFLRSNPFPRPYTFGFYYREKMRAIHASVPDEKFSNVLELGGGESGLSALLFAESRIVNLDFDRTLGHATVNRQPRVKFVCGDAVSLPFRDEEFDIVTLFDVLEHVKDDEQAIREVLRVLRPGGVIVITTPNERWRFPYYRLFQVICPSESTVMANWGHVRRGYSGAELQRLIGVPFEVQSDFINASTVISHDVAFSRLPSAIRWGLCILLWPLTLLGYFTQGRHTRGTETASSWRKPGPIDAGVH